MRTALTVVAAVGAGTVGGVFYAFSTFVMPALRRLPTAGGASAMQQINVTAVRPGLMIALFGTAVVCLGVAVSAGLSWQTRRSLALIAGAALYLLGTVGVTIVYNVPLNNALAGLDVTSADASRIWQDYLQRWTAGNHVRTGAAVAAAALFAWALTQPE